jgi:hypothetical protein
MIYTSRHVSSSHSSNSTYSTVFLLIITIVVLAVGAMIVIEAGKLPALAASGAGRAATTFGVMLASLAGVVLSVILPERIGKAVLLLGASGFFVGLGYALTSGIRF